MVVTDEVHLHSNRTVSHYLLTLWIVYGEKSNMHQCKMLTSRGSDAHTYLLKELLEEILHHLGLQQVVHHLRDLVDC